MFGFIGVVEIERDIEIIIIVLCFIRVISLGLFVRTRERTLRDRNLHAFRILNTLINVERL